jgi:hypothetical protein
MREPSIVRFFCGLAAFFSRRAMAPTIPAGTPGGGSCLFLLGLVGSFSPLCGVFDWMFGSIKKTNAVKRKNALDKKINSFYLSIAADDSVRRNPTIP